MRSLFLILRSFARAKGFAAAAPLTVALGIGVNTVVFSLFDRVLFRPLPYAEPERLVQVQSRPAGPHVINPPWNGAPMMRFAITQSLAKEEDLFSGIAWSVGGDPEPLVPAPVWRGARRWAARLIDDLLDPYRRTSYSQEGEDLILDRLLRRKPRGYYVDVGAFHPKKFSNTHLFYRRGWSGINIDATPGSMDEFRRVRPRDTNLEIAISDVLWPRE